MLSDTSPMLSLHSLPYTYRRLAGMATKSHQSRSTSPASGPNLAGEGDSPGLAFILMHTQDKSKHGVISSSVFPHDHHA